MYSTPNTTVVLLLIAASGFVIALPQWVDWTAYETLSSDEDLVNHSRRFDQQGEKMDPLLGILLRNSGGQSKHSCISYLRQSHISEKSVSRLKKLAFSPNEKVAELAGIVLEVAGVRPYKKKRLRELAKTRRDLLRKLEKTSLIIAHRG